jgi:hypothetical protein
MRQAVRAMSLYGQPSGRHHAGPVEWSASTAETSDAVDWYATADYQRVDPRRMDRRDAIVADDLFLIAHDDRTGRARLHRRGLDLGLAGALLAELVLFGNIEVVDGALAVIDTSPPPDQLVQSLLNHLYLNSNHRSLKEWLAYLGAYARDQVALRLKAAGKLRIEERRRLFRRQPAVYFLPLDKNDAAWQGVRVRELLVHRHHPVTPVDVALAAIVHACGLTRHVLWDDGDFDTGLVSLIDLSRQLSPSLINLIAYVEAAVGDAVLAPR